MAVENFPEPWQKKLADIADAPAPVIPEGCTFFYTVTYYPDDTPHIDKSWNELLDIVTSGYIPVVIVDFPIDENPNITVGYMINLFIYEDKYGVDFGVIQCISDDPDLPMTVWTEG